MYRQGTGVTSQQWPCGEVVPGLVAYPHGGHDHKGKETGPHHIPDAPAVQLQGHGNNQCAEEIQDLGETQAWQQVMGASGAALGGGVS